MILSMTCQSGAGCFLTTLRWEGLDSQYISIFAGFGKLP